ncbi:MAG: SPOR domain-containing protein [Bacteroidales bacterium]|nr:SPOR domain-containing protein [Bacteroidales bacterium]
MTKGILRFVALCCVVTACANSQAQSERIRITGDIAVSRMVDKHVELNQRVKTIPGYRVQIASFSGTNSKTSAFTLRDRFMTDYPDVQAYVAFDEPNFKVKVGDFRTRLEAYAFLQQIIEVYKGYIIKDNIYPEPPTQVEYAPDDEESIE